MVVKFRLPELKCLEPKFQYWSHVVAIFIFVLCRLVANNIVSNIIELHINCNLCSGVGKTSLVHLIMKGSSVARPPQTVGCTVSVKVRLLFIVPT